MLAGLKDVIKRYPGSFAVWATLLNGLTYPLYEIVLAGTYSEEKHLEFLRKESQTGFFKYPPLPHSVTFPF